MDLLSYLDASPRGAASRLAREVGVSTAAVAAWKRGAKRPSTEHAIEIERATLGAVRVETIRPDINWRVLRRRQARAA